MILLFAPKPMCESSKEMSFHTCVDVGIMIIEYPGCTLVHMLFLDDLKWKCMASRSPEVRTAL